MPIKDKIIFTSRRSNWSLINNPDRISGGLLMIIACIAIFEASKLPFGSVRAPDAGFFPLSLSILLLIFAVGIVLNSFMSNPQRTEFSARSWYVVIAALAFVIYAVSLEKAGFVVATVSNHAYFHARTRRHDLGAGLAHRNPERPFVLFRIRAAWSSLAARAVALLVTALVQIEQSISVRREDASH